MKISVYIATSLDGFIARNDGNIEWLHNSGHGEIENEEDFGYKAFMSSVDALVMGRNTYEKVLSFNGEWSYGKKPVYVLTNRGIEIPDEISNTITSLAGSPKEVVQKLKEVGHNYIYLDGGLTIQKFLEAGLVNELTITKIPILIGSGIPLFGLLSKDVKLKHIETRSFNNGFVQSRYEVMK
jgi:dihydrofolate reductase